MMRAARWSCRADALILHLNPLQEALQPGGDVTGRGVAKAIEGVCRTSACRSLPRKWVRAFALPWQSACAISAFRPSTWQVSAAQAGLPSKDKRPPWHTDQDLAEIYRNWGIPTAHCLADIRAALPDMPLIASGGIRHGLDGAKAVRLGADSWGRPAALLQAATRAGTVIDTGQSMGQGTPNRVFLYQFRQTSNSLQTGATSIRRSTNSKV